ncbi:hypothetical protein Tco_1154094 [Tanacetum coccineum]
MSEAEPIVPTSSVTALRIPIIKKGEYDLWSMKMRQYIAITDHILWDIITNGNQTTTDPASPSVSAPKTSLAANARRNNLILLLLLGQYLEYQYLELAVEYYSGILKNCCSRGRVGTGIGIQVNTAAMTKSCLHHDGTAKDGFHKLDVFWITARSIKVLLIQGEVEHYVQEEDTADPFFDDIADKDAAATTEKEEKGEFEFHREMITSQLQGKLWLYDEVRTRTLFVLSSSNRGRLLGIIHSCIIDLMRQSKYKNQTRIKQEGNKKDQVAIKEVFKVWRD